MMQYSHRTREKVSLYLYEYSTHVKYCYVDIIIFVYIFSNRVYMICLSVYKFAYM